MNDIDILNSGIYGPLYDNPQLQDADDFTQILISCLCGARYRINIKGIGSIPSMPPDEIVCRNCGSKANEQSIVGCSAGLFNAALFRCQS